MRLSDAQRVDARRRSGRRRSGRRRSGRRGPLAVTLPLLLCVFVSWGCAGRLPPVAGPPADFARYATWDWHPASAGSVAPQWLRLVAGLRLAVERELAARGYTRVRGAMPDFFVAFRVEVGLDVEVVWETSALQTLSSLHSSPSFETVSSEQVVHAYETGTLSIAIMDALGREAIWRGRAEKRVRRSFAPHAPKLVAHLFANFPLAAPADDWLTARSTPDL